ncbi:hypothetical protein MSHO_43660 [Mycobacterium shottsii]|uniref:Uncharacterized protein n=1 Tax=Mycobacterium shottsii TaxID=133549 RepID=A0A7I7LG68_9MYCO|nr:hypothetical protein MSHO_43660 [Mycobacterium shottsii]
MPPSPPPAPTSPAHGPPGSPGSSGPAGRATPETARSACPAGSAGTQQNPGPAIAAGPADRANVAGRPTCPADSATTRQPAPGPPNPSGTTVTDRGAAPGPARTSRSQQPGRPAVTSHLAGGARPAGAAIAEQPAAIATVGAIARRTVGAIADQRPPGQRLYRRIDRLQQLLKRSGVGGLRSCVGASGAAQRPHKLFVKSYRLRAQLLIGLTVNRKQRRDRR